MTLQRLLPNGPEPARAYGPRMEFVDITVNADSNLAIDQIIAAAESMGCRVFLAPRAEKPGISG